MITYVLINFIKSLGRDNSSSQYGLGIAFGMLLGTIPVLTLHWFVLLFFCVILRINFAAAIFSTIFFSGFTIWMDPTFGRIGLWLLTDTSALLPLWARFYHAPLIPFTEFNRSLVMGRTFLAFFFFLPVFLASRHYVGKYREKLHAFWLGTRIQRNYAHYRRFLS